MVGIDPLLDRVHLAVLGWRCTRTSVHAAREASQVTHPLLTLARVNRDKVARGRGPYTRRAESRTARDSTDLVADTANTWQASQMTRPTNGREAVAKFSSPGTPHRNGVTLLPSGETQGERCGVQRSGWSDARRRTTERRESVQIRPASLTQHGGRSDVTRSV